MRTPIPVHLMDWTPALCPGWLDSADKELTGVSLGICRVPLIGSQMITIKTQPVIKIKYKDVLHLEKPPI